MALDERQQAALVFLARSVRPAGARPWDEVGTAKNVTKVAAGNTADVILGVIRAAADPNAITPGVIATNGPHWDEGTYVPAPPVSETVPRQDCCSVCYQPLQGHTAPDGHAPIRNVRPEKPPVDLAATITGLRDLVAHAQPDHTDQEAEAS